MEPRVSLVTLGVADHGRAKAFYEGLGWSTTLDIDETAFFQANGCILVLWARDKLAKDNGISGDGARWGGITLAHNVGSRDDVHEIIEQAREANLDIAAAVARIVQADAQSRMAGSALLKDEPLVARILDAVVAAAGDVPVTLKIRTGWDKEHKNALTILKAAENAGIQALAIHGRTRACAYTGDAEYDTIKAVKAASKIPIIANGDISTPEKAKYVLDYTGADAVMIGRAAQGRPWIFREIAHFLQSGRHLPLPEVAEIHRVLLEHVHDLYAFYGEVTGVSAAGASSTAMKSLGRSRSG